MKLEGADSRRLRLQIESLPDPPSGDLEPHSKVTSARDTYFDAKRILSLNEENRPSEPSFPETGGLDEEALRELARRLETEGHGGNSQISGRQALPNLAIGSVVSIAGVSGIALGLRLPGLLLLVVGAAMLLWGIYRLGGVRSQRPEESGNLGDHAREEAAAHGVRAEPATLRRLAEELSVANGRQRDFERWREQGDELAKRRDEAGRRLVRALGDRGVAGDGKPESLLKQYDEACAERAEVSRRASTLESLQERLKIREAQERTAAEYESKRAAAEEELREAAIECGIEDQNPESLARELGQWKEERAAALAQRHKAVDEQARLRSLLDGRTLGELEVEASRLRGAAMQMAEGVDTQEMAAVILKDVDSQLEDGRRKLECASGEAARLEGQIKEQAIRLPGVPEAEEELSAAREELNRVQRLETTLSHTLQFLKAAEEKVHRNIAPVLADTVQGWLPEITANRYVDARVDPERLTVTVRGENGAWRDAAHLSHGAREQIYLLLRMSVAEHLTKPGEVCPLILDDVTTQCDGERTAAILRILHGASHRRQVIILSQENEVLEWAETNIRDQRDSLVRLDPREIPA